MGDRNAALGALGGDGGRGLLEVPNTRRLALALTPQLRAKARKVVAFLTAYYGDGGTSAAADGPAPTITTRARLGLVTVTIESADGVTTEDLVTVTIDGTLWIVVDIAMRMLTPRELARCQGFPDSYVLTGTTAEQIERIGNSVCPHPAAAIVAANLTDDEDVGDVPGWPS